MCSVVSKCSHLISPNVVSIKQGVVGVGWVCVVPIEGPERSWDAHKNSRREESRKGGGYGWKASSSSSFSVRARY